MKLVLGNILSHIKEKFPDAEIQEQTNQVVFHLTIDEIQFPVFVKIFQESRLIQIMTFFPGSIQTGAESDVALLLHRANVEIDIPGFGMETQSNAVFYRIMMPALDGEVNVQLLETYLKGSATVCQMFAPVIMAVCFKKMTYQEVLDKLDKQKAEK